MKFRSILIVSISLLAAVLLGACAPAATNPPASEEEVMTESPLDEDSLSENTEDQPAQTEDSMNKVHLPEIDPAAVEGDIISAGSSTVFPLAEAIAVRFEEEGYSGKITIDSIGSGAGFERFCVAGETDVSNASRAIKDSEVESCQAINREPIEFRVGTDAMAFAVSLENDFLEDLSLEQLAQVFSTAQTWADIDPSFPAEKIQRYAPGTDSGTFDYFVEEVMGPAYGDDEEAGKAAILSAENIQFSEDDNVLVQGVAGSPYAIGFFGYAYAQENEDIIRSISLETVAISPETAENGEYPMARPLFIYSDASLMKSKPQVADYVNFFLTYVNDEIFDVGYFPASVDAIDQARQAWLDAMGNK
jgi:phosphate transport system substrate-binding protein